jgi:DNA-binding MarR family transcriptional regulator
MVMDLSALGHTLKPLEREQLIELIPDERDRRARRVRLTQVGQAKFNEAIVLWRRAQDSVEAALRVEKAAELRRVLGYLASESSAARFWKNCLRRRTERCSSLSQTW